VIADTLDVVAGGKGLNQAVAAARAGAQSHLIGAVGSDANAALVLAALEGAGVDASLVRRASGPSGTALIVVDAQGENLIAVVPGANHQIESLEEADVAIIGNADIVVAQLEMRLELVTAAAQAARAHGVPFVLNAAPARDLPAALAAALTLLVVNEQEARVVAGSAADADLIALALLERVPAVAITSGAAGVFYLDRAGARHRIVPPPARVVDTTAAGDTFTGVLATALAEGLSVDNALELASAAGALCVERPGASRSIPTRAEIDGSWARFYSKRPVR
jgi:ribokinase